MKHNIKENNCRRFARLVPAGFVLALVAFAQVCAVPQKAGALEIATLEAPSPLVQIRIMVKAGSAHDPEGKEGLAYMTARLILAGSYGRPNRPVTKEALAELTRPWGGGALPGVRVDKESTTFMMTVPREVFDTYMNQVLEPMLGRPLFDEGELDRIRSEVLTYVGSSLRNENLEMLGLEALDNYIHAGTGRGHLVYGSVQGLKAITREDIRRFCVTYYSPDNVLIGLGSSDRAVRDAVTGAVRGMGSLRGVEAFEASRPGRPALVQGREMTIVAMPNSPAAVIQLGFPLPLLRSDADFWPLWVANVWLGTHRDSYSHLYEVIRQERGYNYGDYSYIEHFASRPAYLFPPFNTPRTSQYFCAWIRPITHEYVAHITKATLWEIERLIKEGLTPEQVESAKNKAKVLYLNYAETSDRLLAARVDDLFYGMTPGTPEGYLDGYLGRIDAVTAEEVNAAIRRYLQVDNVKILVVTDETQARALADQVLAGGPAWAKLPGDYQIAVTEEEGRRFYHVPEERLDTLRLEAAWAYYPLQLEQDRVRVVPVSALFETGAFVTVLPDGR
jgi:zinc protease